MKKRLDQLLVDRGFFLSREKAKAAVMAGLVWIEEKLIDKPGTKIAEDAKLAVKGKIMSYVSRGGLKLEKAIHQLGLPVAGKVILDVGASTGGFTDCSLRNGADKVYAVDVGYGQLAWSLRKDPRVVVLERTNIRHLSWEQMAEKAELATIDVSFISLIKVLPAVKQLLVPEGQVLALIKPQFEAGRVNVGKKGVVRDAKIHVEVIMNILTLVWNLGYYVKGLTYSPVTGPEGNIEYLLWLAPELAPVKVEEVNSLAFIQVTQVVGEAFSILPHKNGEKSQIADDAE